MHNKVNPYDEIIRELTDRGILWLLTNPEHLRYFVKLIFGNVADSLDIAHATQLNRSMIGENLHKNEVDLLYSVPFQDGTRRELIILLIENQSKPDALMPVRVARYMSSVWYRLLSGDDGKKPVRSVAKLQVIVPVVLYTGKDSWRPRGLRQLLNPPAVLAGYVPEFDILTLNINDVDEPILHQSAIGLVLLAFRDINRPIEQFRTTLRTVVKEMRKLHPNDCEEFRTAYVFLHMLVGQKRRAEEDSVLYKEFVILDSEIGLEGSEIMLTIEQKWRGQGRQEGREEGRQEGELTFARDTLVRQATLRLGQPSEAISRELASITEVSLFRALLDRVLDALSWDDLLARQ